MDALILAAGLGSRLGEITRNQQKCLLPINGVPLLELWINALFSLDIKKLYINTHHCAHQTNELIESSVHKEKIHLLHESTLLGTGGTLLFNKNLFANDDLLFLHGDNFINFSCLKGFIKNFKDNYLNENYLFWMMLHKTNAPENCGVVKLKGKKVIEFYEKYQKPPSQIANSAIYILKKKFINEIEQNNLNYPISFSDDLIPQYLGKIYGYFQKEDVIDIGTKNSYEKVK